jgi:hypothetical protein
MPRPLVGRRRRGVVHAAERVHSARGRVSGALLGQLGADTVEESIQPLGLEQGEQLLASQLRVWNPQFATFMGLARDRPHRPSSQALGQRQSNAG